MESKQKRKRMQSDDWVPMTKIPVERLCENDQVRAVKNGPLGKVIDKDRYGWTIVEYGDSTFSYKHGVERLYLIEATDSNGR